MMVIDEQWVPGFGEIVTWFAMDKAGAIAVMVNNCFGSLPKVLLEVTAVEQKLDSLSEYLWEESGDYEEYPKAKNGKTILDLYSACAYRHLDSRAEVERWIADRSSLQARLTEYNLPAIKGVYIYHAIEGSVSGEDFPSGYDGESKMGDYFRYLIPSVKAGIEDIPFELRGIVVVSDSLEFSDVSFWSGSSIDEHFSRMY
ncbi:MULTISPECIES: hypothetical protein [unclassified Pseudomonas]|jgi:hypothetical protein|uniref:hypothetical protein n=2 Tax=Pseudomonas TaxID=286 RepID=UPI0009B92F1F|nr:MULTISPECIES: hypothetical protein [unclassified Pseudomonas]NVZ32149.1 hypothetical protein [Pseudomonas sp. A4002]NWB39463.1 hypothetical protein [Pseudomonas sp. E6002]NWB53114.1 hypothetical protein [Pseudomonas sp. F8002]NWB74760.1 hypothetical protein [Pseudomonas sp. G5001]NWB81101.1 hypothetical protein [Pseudomonas sp. F9001]NWD60181.1 hypothetical protein [Pseudomonas sp. IPO3774]QQD53636.1 hypothetical protein MHB_0026435 [Pseudomonas fluorescens BBc6R8]